MNMENNYPGVQYLNKSEKMKLKKDSRETYKQ